MPEINLDDHNDRQALAILQVVQRHHALVKVNRFLLVLVFVLTIAIFVLGLVFLPRQSILDSAKSHQADPVYALQNPAISAEINNLKGQMFGLVSGSIESKLRALEENIKRGSVADSLNTIQDLKSDVKVLGAYSNDAQVKTQEVVVNQELIKEMANLKDLVYLTFVSCGLMFAALAGVWLRHRYRLTHQQAHRAFLSRHD